MIKQPWQERGWVAKKDQLCNIGTMIAGHDHVIVDHQLQVWVVPVSQPTAVCARGSKSNKSIK